MLCVCVVELSVTYSLMADEQDLTHFYFNYFSCSLLSSMLLAAVISRFPVTIIRTYTHRMRQSSNSGLSLLPTQYVCMYMDR